MDAAPLVPATILVIDDDAALLGFLEELLTLAGYQVRTASSETDGLRQATTGPVSAILLDRRLSDVDGLILCRSLRDLLGEEVPILLLTGDADRALDTAARAAGASTVIGKPFAVDALLRQVAAHLGP
ncbi:MAG TPA: response regulator [Herpetosiphonaceae bacterium]